MKMRRIFLSLFMACTLMASALTDQQVIDYIKQQMALGKSDQEIGKELMAKGVTPEQAKRIKARYDAEQKAEAQNNRNLAGSAVMGSSTGVSNAHTLRGQEVAHTSVSDDPGQSLFETDDVVVTTGGNRRSIYGHDVFNGRALTFEPSENLATPQNYRLGPGDEVVIDIWGTSEDHLRQVISPEGSIMIAQLGPVYLNGMTIADANKHIKNTFSRKYAGMADAETDVQVTLGQVRTIQIDVLGEVSTPGTFRLSPFSSVFHALYKAGGINDIGSMRNIQVLRNGKKIAGVDIYDYLFGGKSTGNIRLMEGDVIIVPPYTQLVNVSGNVKRPMYYEIKPNETIQTLLDYAGGLTGDAYSGMVRLQRSSGTENELYNVDSGQFNSYRLQDGDIVSVGTILDRYSNRVELKGAVERPGMFALGKDITTVRDLIKKADGLSEDAYTDRVLLYREGPDKRLEIQALDLGAILAGSQPDVPLKRNDILVISSIDEVEELGSITIAGYVGQPGSYPYAKNMTVEDLILQAGGLLEGASMARVDVARRIYDPEATSTSNQISNIYTVNIGGGLGKDKGEQFLLRPYDRVDVRKAPGYTAQQIVTVDGMVLFDGAYTITQRNERLTDLIKRAGGLIDGAYVKGAYLERKLSESEFKARKDAMSLAINNSKNVDDSIALSSIEISERYNVGIDLEKALNYPGSSYDLVVQPGDRLFVPEQQSTVKISGEVMYPNAVIYVPGKKIKYYIDMAGGYGQRAKKNKAFIVYLNGTVARVTSSTVIEPGSQIIVPSKPQNSGTDWTKIMTFATGFSSVAAMAATITNIFKR